MNKRRYFTYL